MKIILKSTNEAVAFGKKSIGKASIFRKLKRRYFRTKKLAARLQEGNELQKAVNIVTKAQLFREAYESVKGRIR